MASKPKKTKAEKEHHEALAAMPCVLCEYLGLVQKTPTTVHHPREGQGMSQRSSHWLGIPLCWDCHQGKCGLHGDKSLLRLAKLTELDLIAIVVRKMAETISNLMR